MCGRFTLHTSEDRIRKEFHLEHTELLGLKPRYNIAPTQEVPIVRAAETGNEMILARWGLVPHWSKEPETRYSTINARLETVAEKPTYRRPFKRQRCLIPADGFYEWPVIDGRKIPHYIYNRGGDLFALAGLWDHWEGEGQELYSCSIIVRPADEKFESVHDRVPAVIAPTNYDHWLDTRIDEKEEIMSLIGSAQSSSLKFHPVGTWVNSPKHDDESCIQRAKK